MINTYENEDSFYWKRYFNNLDIYESFRRRCDKMLKLLDKENFKESEYQNIKNKYETLKKGK